ncbi:MAG: RNA polymerase ECF-type sigma factor [Burkholderiaceae bacterium]|jgi:RNA polymerase sigma-70 factor (ECF subfamily)|nr:MAG: RNA polymerase ECF-type sigma factor [Burkholderiaceae bacterium]
MKMPESDLQPLRRDRVGDESASTPRQVLGDVHTTTGSDPHVEDDLSLVGRSASGDRRAFEALMHRHNQRLYRSVRSVLRDEADAEEAVQDAWWKAYTHLREFRADARVSTWLTRIALNEALMRQRRNKSRDALIQPEYQAAATLNAMPDELSAIPAPASAGPDQLAWRAEIRRLIERRIDDLPEHYRTIFMLRGVEEMSAAEVAAALGLPEATVRVRFMRARRLLQTSLEQEIGPRAVGAFSFAGERCERIVAAVMTRIDAAGRAPNRT